MNEEAILKAFAKSLGVDGEDALNKIEEKKIKEQKFLEGLAVALGPEAQERLDLLESRRIAEEAIKHQQLLDEKERREKQNKMLEALNAGLAKLVGENPEHRQVIEQEVIQTIEEVTEAPLTVVAKTVQMEEVVVENGAQPQPELPKDDIITKAVKDISKRSAPGNIQAIADEMPDSVRKELTLLKKSIADLHRFATNHSQLGGGGEVNLRYLDDVDRTTIDDGLYLRYDLASNTFVFDTPAGGGGGSGANGISITDATINSNGSLIITYSNNATANAGYVVGPPGANGANGANGSAGANGSNGANGIGITSSVVNGSGYLTITYSNSYVANAGYVVGAQGPAGANGANGATGNTGPAGADGANGISVTSANVNSNGYLIIGYSNSTTANAGYVVGPAGSNVSQIQSDWTQTNNTSVDYIKNKPFIPSVIDDLSDVSIASPTNGQVLKYNGSYWYNGTDATGTGGGTATPGYYGSFYDNTTQTAALANTGYAMKYNTTVESNEVTVDDTHANTRVYVTYTGVYNIQFSVQIHNTGGGGAGKNVMIWLAKNGTAVEDTATDVSCDTNTPYKVAAWNFVLTLNSGDYFELMWATDNTSIVLEYATNVLDGSPHIPSVILTVTQVAAILIPTDITGAANTANNANYLDGYHGNQYAFANTLTLYQTTAGLSANVATLTANAAGYLNGKTESNLNVNNALTANASTYLNGKTESNLNVNNALTSNNASYLGGNTAADLRTYTDNKSGNAYSNAVAYAASNTTVYSTFAQNTSVYTVFAQNTSVYSTFAQNTSVYTIFAQNNSVYSTFAQNTSVYSTFAQNTSVYSTFAQNTAIYNTLANYVQNTDSRTLSGNLNFTGVNNYFTNIYVGANNLMNVTTHFIGNSTVNTNISAGSLSVNGAVVANNSGVYATGTVNAASLTTSFVTVNTTTISAGANNYMNATHHFLSTNSTMNTIVTANQITLNGSNVITTATVVKIYYANGTQAYP